jgi:hypothetical protein
MLSFIWLGIAYLAVWGYGRKILKDWDVRNERDLATLEALSTNAR